MIGGSSLKLRAVVIGGALALAGCAGNGAQGSCGDATGMCAGAPGDPTGQWGVEGFCSYPADMPNRPMSLTELTTRPQNPSIAAPQPQPTTDGSWCYDLILKPATATAPSAVSSVNLWHDVPALGAGSSVTFSTDGTYAVDLKFSEPVAGTHFTPYCLQYQGQTQINCADLATEITAFYANAAGANRVAFNGINCASSASDGGCDCGYSYSVEVSDMGTWVKSGDLIQESSTQYLYNGISVMSQAPELSLFATYCQSNSTLLLSGYLGSDLSSVVGLRTLSLARM
jgi:hypothetical protein